MKKKFQTESKQLLELMIHSIYSQKDVFLRELISNASDALDKRQFMALQNEKQKADEYYIEISVDTKKKIIKIQDNGIGMNEKDLENNLGTIAKSGTKEFIKKIKDEKEKIEAIGQFGVGFYSSFIVAQKVEVQTKKLNSKALKWTSNGVDSYDIEDGNKKDIGTEIILYLKNDEDILKFLDINTIKQLIKKYSDYVKYPIYMEEEQTKEDENKKEVTEVVRNVINSQKALWKRDKKDITQQEYDDFYKSKYYDFTAPIHTIHTKAEGTFNYEFLGFIPEQKPFDYNAPTYKKGLDLYSKGILIDNNLEYLLPDAFNFVRGLIDSQDLNLNISREMLQKDSVVNKLTNLIEKKIQKELLTLQKKHREKYNKLFDNFGRTIIFGLYNEYGAKKDLVKDLVMFKSSKTSEYITLKEYIENNKDQDKIYYVPGESIDKINQLPIMDKIRQKDIEVLYFLNDVDEFAIQMLVEYEKVAFQSITSVEFNLDSEEEKEKIDKLNEENKDLLQKMKDNLSGKVADVKLTSKLTDSAVYITNQDGLSLEMEKVLSQMSDQNQAKSTKVLELNPDHDIFKSLKKIENEKERLLKYTKLLYNQAMLLEGFEIEDKKEYSSLIDEIIINSIK